MTRLFMPTQRPIPPVTHHNNVHPSLTEAQNNITVATHHHYRRQRPPFPFIRASAWNDRSHTRKNNMRSLWITTLLCISNSARRTVEGSISHMALFTPPLPSTKLPHSLSLQRTAAIRLGSTRSRRHNIGASTGRDSSQRLHGNSRKQSSKNKMSKIKSPSNSYSQFYKEGILVGIERTSSNSRRISGEVIIDTSIDDIWAILTDYDNLNVHVPNLIESRVISNGSSRVVGSSGGGGGGGAGSAGPRVHQKGAQRIFGFEFSADVTLEMKECIYNPSDSEYMKDEMKTYSIDFQCVQSQFFSQFDGSWILEEYSKSRTMVRYIVDVMPKGPVPVAALEWRIKEDVPVNILAVSRSASAVSAEKKVNTISQQPFEPILDTRQQQLSQQQHRRFQTLQRSNNNPLLQLANLATRNIEQTAKLVLPASMASTVEQAISAVYSLIPSTSERKTNFFSSSSSSSSSLAETRSSNNKVKDLDDTSARVGPENFIDWYQDETMAMYLEMEFMNTND